MCVNAMYYNTRVDQTCTLCSLSHRISYWLYNARQRTRAREPPVFSAIRRFQIDWGRVRSALIGVPCCCCCCLSLLLLLCVCVSVCVVIQDVLDSALDMMLDAVADGHTDFQDDFDVSGMCAEAWLACILLSTMWMCVRCDTLPDRRHCGVLWHTSVCLASPRSVPSVVSLAGSCNKAGAQRRVTCVCPWQAIATRQALSVLLHACVSACLCCFKDADEDENHEFLLDDDGEGAEVSEEARGAGMAGGEESEDGEGRGEGESSHGTDAQHQRKKPRT